MPYPIHFLLYFGLIAISSCTKRPKLHPENTSEKFTAIQLQLTDENRLQSHFLTWTDLDGYGGEAPHITSDTLPANGAFLGFLNLIYTGADSLPYDVSYEIETEGVEHQVFYEAQGIEVDVLYKDTDNAGLPIGLFTNITTGNAGMGTLKITLKHQADKYAKEVAEGNINYAGGQTDFDIVFPVVIE